jgi:mono/diheme cytochrome c family protein
VRIPPPFSFTNISTLVLLCSLSGYLIASPHIPGLQAKHPLNDPQQGRLLIHELRCASCHDCISTNPPPAPNLQNISRLNPDFLQNYIANPSAHVPGTKMPDLMADKSPEEKTELATALTAYLLSLENETFPHIEKSNTDDGKKLFHETGCIACHTPRDGSAEALPSDVNLDHISKKYTSTGLAAFLHEPLKYKPAGRMPDMRLSRSEAELITSFLLETTTANPEKPAPNAELIAKGKATFQTLNCIACHSLEDSTPSPKITLKSPDLTKGCLSEKPSPTPNYNLSPQQLTAIRAALDPITAPLSSKDKLNIQLTQLNCISCHQRDDFGGVHPDRDSYFHSTEEALGNESRIPPPLTLVGAKLRPEWMNKVLYQGEAVRPYMTSRMPLFGNHALEDLTKLFSENDKLPPFDFPPVPKESEPMIRDGGHMLLGDQGLSCISCHNYNGIESPSMKGLDIMTSYQRLQPAWFNQFMRNPAHFRPGIIMPSYWPGDKAVQTEILNGDTDLQLQALWNQFSLGRSARDPSGLRAADPELLVTDKTRTYRGRSTVAGYRGIAVGFPGGLNYAFNAQTGALSSIWKGKYITVGWRGQGSGNFTPAEKNIQLAQDVAFLSELPLIWPLHPIRTKENPVNPDPEYPRQHAYAFEGYSIADDGTPTFRYRSGNVSIEDTSNSASDKDIPHLIRTLTFKTEKKQSIHFRPLTGQITKSPQNSFKTEDVNLTPSSKNINFAASTRQTNPEELNDELIITLDLPAGTSTLTLDYALP